MSEKKSEKLWGGRYSHEIDSFVDEMNASIPFDWILYPYDIQGSIAHVKMLARQGIIKVDEADRIIQSLLEIKNEIDEDHTHFPMEDEDIHMHIEKRLIEKIGDVGKKLHTARSRNDQVALDTRLFVREKCLETGKLIVELQKSFLDKSEEYLDVIIPGYTHLQRAQPVLFSHYLLAYYEMLTRDFQRFVMTYRSADSMPLGSAALAGSTFPVDRDFVKNFLNFHWLSRNSLDAVSDRDFILDFLYSSAVTIMHLSRLAEELIIWSTAEFSLIQIDERYTTGSSIMPQKRNPDLAELVRGKTGRIYGNLLTLFTVLKGLPLAYNKDLQEDKEPLFDTVKQLSLSLRAMSKMIATIKVDKERAKEMLKGGFITATDLAEYLVKKGVPFRDAHRITGEIVAYAEKKGKELYELELEELKRFSSLIENDVFEAIMPETSVKQRKVTGGTSPDYVRELLKKAKQEVEWRAEFIKKHFQPY